MRFRMGGLRVWGQSHYFLRNSTLRLSWGPQRRRIQHKSWYLGPRDYHLWVGVWPGAFFDNQPKRPHEDSKHNCYEDQRSGLLPRFRHNFRKVNTLYQGNAQQESWWSTESQRDFVVWYLPDLPAEDESLLEAWVLCLALILICFW